MLAPLLIEAMVDRAELPALVAAAEQLSGHLGGHGGTGGAGTGWPIELRVGERDLAAGAAASIRPRAPSLVVTSLFGEVPRTDEPIVVTERRWLDRLRSLADDGGSPHRVFVCTVFRYVATASADRTGISPPVLVERIRRLNLLAAELSHATGVGVIDIDRVFGLLGARELGSDYRMTGAVAAEVAGHAVVAGLLAAGLDPFVPPEIEERARASHGGIYSLGGLVGQRLARARRGQEASGGGP